MPKTLFSKLLLAHIAVVSVVLIVFSFMTTGIFRSHYSSEIKAELSREVDEINRIALEEYMDEHKRPVAREKLFAAARKYGAMFKLYFNSPEYGVYRFWDENEFSKWASCEDADLHNIIENAYASGEKYTFVNDALSDYTDMRTLTVARPLQKEDGKNMGMLLLHYDMGDIYKTLNRLYLDVFASAFFAGLIIVPIALIISKHITKPVSVIDKVVTDFSHGRYDSRVKLRGKDELARLGSSFNDMADKVAGLEKTRRDFVANVSHELRSPLTSINGFIEAMEDGTIPPEEHHKYLEVVLDETRRMTGMVNDLLDIARIESGQYKLNISVFDINELVGRVLITFEPRITAKNIDVDVNLSDEPLYCEADRTRIAQVLHNLIDNAIKFIPEKDGLLTLACIPEGKKIKVVVADNGSGIPKEDLPHVFDRFYKTEKAHTHTNRSGTGIGLSIVKLVMDQHNADITVDSDGNGTRFVFILKRASEPVKKISAAEDIII